MCHVWRSSPGKGGWEKETYFLGRVNNILWFVHSFNNYLLSIYYELCIVPNDKDTVSGKKTPKSYSPVAYIFMGEEQKINKYVKKHYVRQ